MIYSLDTNAVIAILKGQPVAVRTRLRRVAPKATAIAVSSIVLFDLWREFRALRAAQHSARKAAWEVRRVRLSELDKEIGYLIDAVAKGAGELERYDRRPHSPDP